MHASERWRFPFCRPTLPLPAEWLGDLEPAYAARRFSNGGPVVARLEEQLRDWMPPDREAACVASGTAGIAATLLALDVRGPVAVPAFTFAATASAVELAGCTPVFCDVEESSWELDPADAAAAVAREGCVAIMHVRPFGLCRPLDGIEAVAAEAGVPLVVDAAAAFGGRLPDGTPMGGAGAAEIVSFHATKVFAVGEGGAVIAPPGLTQRIREVSNFGFVDRRPARRGLNAKMSEMTAAVGCAMARHLDEHLGARRRAAEILGAAAVRGGASLPVEPGIAPWQGLPLALGSLGARDETLRALWATGVEARVYYRPGLHRAPAFAAGTPRALPVTDRLSERMICLPVYSDFTEGELADLARAVEAALAESTTA